MFKGTETRFEVVIKNGKPFLRQWHPVFQYEGGYHDSMIYKARTEAPYFRYMSSYLGNIPLNDEMKEQLKAALKGA